MSGKKHKKLHLRSGKTAVKTAANHAEKASAVAGARKPIPPVQWAKAVAEFLHLPNFLLSSNEKHPIKRINE